MMKTNLHLQDKTMPGIVLESFARMLVNLSENPIRMNFQNLKTVDSV